MDVVAVQSSSQRPAVRFRHSEMSRNLGARNPIRTVFRVTFVENNAMFTIFLVLMGLLLSVVHADKEPHQNDAIVARVTEIPNHLVSENDIQSS